MTHALTILSWYENLPKNEQPPRHIWWSSKLLDEWFEKVNEDRSNRSSGSRDEEVPLTDNELIDRDDLRPR